MDDGTLLFKFSNRVSAYDVKFKEEIPKKGKVLCKFAEFWFNELSVPNHFVKTLSDTEMLVKQMKMLPIECVVRGYLYGSLANRWKRGEVHLPHGTDTRLAAKLSEPLFDPTTKSDTSDVPISKEEALAKHLVTKHEFETLSKTSVEIYQKMSQRADSAGFILADLKLEFGILDGKITLGDSLGPDEYRLWPKDQYKVGKIQEAYDKQLLRDWLTEHGYQDEFESARKKGIEPNPPSLPTELINQLSARYVTAFERFTGERI